MVLLTGWETAKMNSFNDNMIAVPSLHALQNNNVVACFVQFVYTYSRSQSVCFKIVRKLFPAMLVLKLSRDTRYAFEADTITYISLIKTAKLQIF